MMAVFDRTTGAISYVDSDLPIVTNPNLDIENQINDAIQFLAKTDHKMSVDYEPTPDENIEQIKAERIAKRRFIRENRNA